MKRKTFPIVAIVFLIAILFLSPPQFASSSGSQNEEKGIKVPRVHEQLSTILDKQSINQGNALKIYYSNGSSQLLPIDYNGPLALSTINVGNSSTTMIFVNDREKIDRSLLNVTHLNHYGYLINNKVRVIILIGEQISHETYLFSNVPSTRKESVISATKRLNGTVETMYTPYLPLMAVTVPYGKIFELASHVSVAHVWPDIRYRVHLDESVPLIKDPTRWSAIESNYGSAINGSGVKIAILDTGIDSNHPDFFFPNGTSKIIANESFVPDETTGDGYGHGTHVASIAAGTGRASNGKYVGVAHDALLMAVKVLSDAGWGYNSWIISGIQWAVNHSANVLSMSFGADINDDGSDPMSLAVDWAVDNGAVCTVAAGNTGPSKFTVGIPAVSKKAITVGASTKQDEIAGFSSRGPSADWRLKPDVVAPGYMITAARASGTSMGSPIDQNYTRASGTSMATPHVAGAAALLLQMHPDWKPLHIKAALMNWANFSSSVDVLAQGAGRIDCSNSANATLLIVQPSSSFGILTTGQSKNTTLTFINLVNFSLTSDLSTNTTCDGEATNYVHTNVSSIVVPAGGNATVMLSVGPMDIDSPEGWYQGQLMANVSNGQKAGIPYFFGVFSILRTTIYDTDGQTEIDASVAITTYPNLTYVTSSWGRGESEIYLRSGNYSICAQMAWVDRGQWPPDFNRMFMLQKGVTVPRGSIVDVSISLAEANVSYIPTVDSSGHNLTVHSFTQYFSGGPQTWYEEWQFYSSSWAFGSSWFGFDLNVSYLTFYSTEYDPPDRLCEAFGYFASSEILSEVYLMPFKFWNVSSLPSSVSYPESDLAKYYAFYDMPEIYPESGLNIMYAFWFTWNHLGGFQGWGWDVHRVLAGINATLYLAPYVGTYFMYYMPTYSGWADWPARGPIEEKWIGQHYPYPQIPLEKGETGSLKLGRFSFAPYWPGLQVNVTQVEGKYNVTLYGDLWTNLTWPHWQWGYWGGGLISPFPTIYPTYLIYVNGTLLEEGNLTGSEGWNGEPFVDGVDWGGISESWNMTSGRVLLQLVLPSLAALSKKTVYNMSFTLGGSDAVPPRINAVFYPLNFTVGQDVNINFAASDVGLGVKFHALKYSFDNGTTWYEATYQNPYYQIPPEDVDSLALLINVTDNAGNSIQYLTKPLALNSQTKLTFKEKEANPDELIILGNLTSVQSYPLQDFAVLLTTNSTNSTYSDTDSKGDFSYYTPSQTGTYRIDALLHKVGLYQSSSNWTILTITFYGLIIDQAFVSDDRCDVGSVQTVGFHAKWASNSSDIIGGTIFINGTGYITNGTGWASFNVTWDTIGKRVWTVTGVSCDGITTYKQFVSDPYIIWDRLEVYDYDVTDGRCDIGTSQRVWVRVKYDYDDAIFDDGEGSLNIEGIPATWNADNAYWYITVSQDIVTKVNYLSPSSFTDTTYDLTIIAGSVSQSIIWDKVIVTLTVGDNRINVGSTASITKSGVYQYDGATFNGSITLNDTTIKDAVGKYTYTVHYISDPAYKLTKFRSNSIQVIFDKVSIILSTEDSRIDVRTEVTILWNGVHEYDGTLFNGTVTFNDTLTKSEVGRYGYTVSGINGDAYGITVFESNSVPIIFDRIRIAEGGVSSGHCQVGLTQTVWLRAEYEYDSVRFDDTKGILFLNGEPMDWSDTNSRWEYSATSDMIDLQTFKLTSVSDEAHQLTAVNDLVGEKGILWDEIEIKEITAATTTFGVTKVKVTVIYTSTKDPVTGATVTVNGKECTETETGIYTCETQDWSLTGKINVQVDLPDFTETTATASTIHTMNLTIYLTTLSAMIASIIIILLLKKRKLQPTQITT